MVAIQILIDGFVISALYGLGAIGFTLIFGVTGVLNLAHGSILVIAALVGWYMANHFGLNPYAAAAMGIVAGFVSAFVTYFVVI